jgi:WhiB family redox-sensing transcriptional regulator
MTEADFGIREFEVENTRGRVAAVAIDIITRQPLEAASEVRLDEEARQQLLRGPYIGRLRAAEGILRTVRKQFRNDAETISIYIERVEECQRELDQFDAGSETAEEKDEPTEVVAEDVEVAVVERTELVIVHDDPEVVETKKMTKAAEPQRPVRQPRRQTTEARRVSASPRRSLGKAASSSMLLSALGASNDSELEWQDRALCAQTDPEAFFPEKGGSTREAKKVCVGCEVRAECLHYALSNDERFGIWGGLTLRERNKLKKRAT